MDQYQANIDTLLKIAGEDAPAVLVCSEGDNGIGIFSASAGSYQLVVVSVSVGAVIVDETYASMGAALDAMNRFLKDEYQEG